MIDLLGRRKTGIHDLQHGDHNPCAGVECRLQGSRCGSGDILLNGPHRIHRSGLNGIGRLTATLVGVGLLRQPAARFKSFVVVLGPGPQGNELRHCHVVGNHRPVHVGAEVIVAGLSHRRTVGGRVGGVL